MDILVQVAAANSALNSFSKGAAGPAHLHLRGGRPARGQRGKKLDELVKLLPKLMK